MKLSDWTVVLVKFSDWTVVLVKLSDWTVVLVKLSDWTVVLVKYSDWTVVLVKLSDWPTFQLPSCFPPKPHDRRINLKDPLCNLYQSLLFVKVKLECIISNHLRLKSLVTSA